MHILHDVPTMAYCAANLRNTQECYQCTIETIMDLDRDRLQLI
jgi:hypothetical protein